MHNCNPLKYGDEIIELYLSVPHTKYVAPPIENEINQYNNVNTTMHSTLEFLLDCEMASNEK